jgi:hypothetical protein
VDNQNLACRIFKEQLELVQQLPESERAIVLYNAIVASFNQIENQNEIQIENQNENAYVSVSVLGNCIYNLLSRNIVWKSFSNNYGGARVGAGRPKNNQIENQDENQDENQVEKKPVRGAFKAPTLEEVLTYAKQMNDTAGMGGFTCGKQTAIDFFNQYDRQGWMLGNGNHMTNWKSGLRRWADEQKRKLLDE